MIIIYIILAVWLMAWLLPKIAGWLLRSGARKMQRRMFEQMGINPDLYDEAVKASREEKPHGQQYTASSGFGRRRRHAYSGHKRIIPPEYAETVSFVEMAATSTEPWSDHAGSPVFREYRDETQITDAKWTLVK